MVVTMEADFPRAENFGDEDNFEAGIPESFNVLVKEIRSLGLNIELLDEDLNQ